MPLKQAIKKKAFLGLPVFLFISKSEVVDGTLSNNLITFPYPTGITFSLNLNVDHMKNSAQFQAHFIGMLKLSPLTYIKDTFLRSFMYVILFIPLKKKKKGQTNL